MYSKTPNKVVVHAIISKLLNWLIILDSAKKYPTIITGKEEINILKNKILFSKKFMTSLRK